MNRRAYPQKQVSRTGQLAELVQHLVMATDAAFERLTLEWLVSRYSKVPRAVVEQHYRAEAVRRAKRG